MKKEEEIILSQSQKIFLSYKGSDKSLIRRFKKILEELGFSTWLDEDSISANESLERALFNGITNESCAVVFFITSNFKDENYLETEINYALTARREKRKGKFAIITLVFDKDNTVEVPPILAASSRYQRFDNELDALCYVLRNLPIKVGGLSWKEGNEEATESKIFKEGIKQSSKRVKFEIKESSPLNAFYLEYSDKGRGFVSRAEQIVFLNDAIPPVQGIIKLDGNVLNSAAADFARRNVSSIFQGMMTNYNLTLTLYVDDQVVDTKTGDLRRGNLTVKASW